MAFFINEIETFNFRNHARNCIEFHPRVNFIVGPNASGKTSLLDAIYYLSFTKGFLSSNDQSNILDNESFFLIKGKYSRNDSPEEIYCAVKQNDKKVFKRNDKEYDRFSEHIGLFPLVIVSPYDSGLIHGGSEERRKYIDGVISQFDPTFLDATLRYNKVLKQRNRILKDFTLNIPVDLSILEVYNEQLIAYGNHIFQKRSEFLDSFMPLFQEIYERLSGNNEKVNISYSSQLIEKSFIDLLQDSIFKDKQTGFTTCGIHKDDLLFTINNNKQVKTAASQGQQKTWMLALKMAQYEYLKMVKNMAPIILLDDIFDKLDDNRVGFLLDEVINNKYGQIFITHTNLQMLQYVLGNINSEYKVIYMKNGEAYEQ